MSIWHCKWLFNTSWFSLVYQTLYRTTGTCKDIKVKTDVHAPVKVLTIHSVFSFFRRRANLDPWPSDSLRVSSQEKHLKGGGKQGEVGEVRHRSGFRSLASSWMHEDFWKVPNYTKVFQFRGKWYWLSGPHFSQPFATGHLQGPIGELISQAEAVPISQPM